MLASVIENAVREALTDEALTKIVVNAMIDNGMCKGKNIFTGEIVDGAEMRDQILQAVEGKSLNELLSEFVLGVPKDGGFGLGLSV